MMETGEPSKTFFDETDAGAANSSNATSNVQDLAQLRSRSRRIIAAFATASAVAATVPLPVKDALMLSPIELVEVNALAGVYGIPQEESVRKIFDGMIELGMASVVARRAISILEARPRLPLIPKIKSALIAATIVTLVGSLSAYTFEQVYLGKLSIDELGIVRKLRESTWWQTAERAVASTLENAAGSNATEGLEGMFAEVARAVSATL